jgi:hypothetical protein
MAERILEPGACKEELIRIGQLRMSAEPQLAADDIRQPPPCGHRDCNP